MAEQQGQLVAAEERRTKVAELYVQCYSQRKIAATLGIALCTVNHDLKVIREEWKQERVDDFEHRRELESRKIVMMANEAWQAWEKSKGVVTTTKAKRVTGRTTDPDNPLPDLTTAEKTEREQHGDPRYWDAFFRCVERMCALWGLDAPKRTEISGPEGGPITLATMLKLVAENPPPIPELDEHPPNVIDVEAMLLELENMPDSEPVSEQNYLEAQPEPEDG